MQKHVIEIPPGEDFIEAAEIPNWIAEVLEQIPDSLPILSNLQKKTLIAPDHWRLDDLAPDDWAMLDSAWKDLPDVRNVSMEQFKAYRQAFESAGNRPAWDLHAESQDLKAKAKNRQMNVRNDHFRNLEAAAEQGEIDLLSPNRLPTVKVEPGTLISFDDARTYLSALGFELHISTTADPTRTPESKAPKAADSNPASWVDQVRALALAYIAKHKTSNLFPSQKDVCGHLEKATRKQKIYGPQGKPLSQSYIQRNAIQGAWWQKNKP